MATCVCVSFTFLGATLRVAGATTLACFLGFSASSVSATSSSNLSGKAAASSINSLVVFVTLQINSLLGKFVVQAQCQTCHLIVCTEPSVLLCPILRLWIYSSSFRLFFTFYLIRFFLKKESSHCLTCQLLSLRSLNFLVLKV